MTDGATRALARYAVGLRFRDIPPEVIARAKDCILDTLAVSLYGSTKPWCRSVVSYARSLGARGGSTVFGESWKAPPPHAALANGTMAHAFELDNVRQPGAGVHPGGTVFIPALAVGEATKANGKNLLAAFVAGTEVVSRIGVAAGNSVEKNGFHAPALTGTFGAAAAAGYLLRLNERALVSAFGIAGSYSGGLIEFSRSVDGAMIKRLHLGKAAEGGIAAASLARRGFAGPATVLEGEFGFCRSFSREPDLSYLTHRLGEDFETLNICIKRFACHINAHAPIEALQALREQHRFAPEDIQRIAVAGMEKLVTHHNILSPGDLMSAQYSIPFCVALSVFFDPSDPESFSEKRLGDRKVLALTRLVELKVDEAIEKNGWDRAARVTVHLKDGRAPSQLVVHFKGTPQNPLSREELYAKAEKLTRRLLPRAKLARLTDAVNRLEKLPDVSALGRMLQRRAR
ncbi:MAG TPA: MmgE/PrpD family protein [Candidatus Acidoferrales bacterium]|nr:MmgE/PrpD family protein [Candidatus Acidoferrales bacterium]